MHSFECNNLQMAVFELPTTTAVISVSPHWKRVARNSSDYFGFSYRQWRGGCAAAGKKVSDSDYRASPDTCLHTYTLVPQHTYTDTLILTTWQACPQSRPGNAGQRMTLLLCVSSVPPPPPAEQRWGMKEGLLQSFPWVLLIRTGSPDKGLSFMVYPQP